MFSAIIRRIERLYDPFADYGDEAPPRRPVAFARWTLKPLRGALFVFAGLSLSVGAIEVGIIQLIGALVDRAAAGRSPLYRYYIEQFAKVGLRPTIEEPDFPSPIGKMHSREAQMIHWGWGADYPDPENFLQLFYGPNADGTYNESQYRNGEYDALYSKIAQMPPSPERDALIRRMVERLAVDLPKVFLFHRVSHYFTQRWTASLQPNPLGLYVHGSNWSKDLS